MRETGESPLSDRWYIFKDGQSVGPLTAAEIREALRDGTFDPFDLVSRDGSSVRRELVEVDEIFFNSKVVYEGDSGDKVAKAAAGDGVRFAMGALADSARETSGGPDSGSGGTRGRGVAAADHDGGGGFVPTAEPPPSRPSGQFGDMGIGNGHLALADQQTQARPTESRHPGRRGGRGKGAKRYQLIDGKGRQLGPLGAGEIQSLFYKGVLDKSVAVVRQGSSARVPVAKFVAVYSENARPGRPPRQGAHPVMRPPSQNTLLRMAIVQQGRILAQKDTMTIVALLVGVTLLFVAGFIAYRSGARVPDWFTSKPAQTRQIKKGRPLPDQVRKAPVRKPAKKWVKPGAAKPKAGVRKPPGQADPKKARPDAATRKAAAAKAKAEAEAAKKKALAAKENRLRLAELERARKVRATAAKPYVSPNAVKPAVAARPAAKAPPKATAPAPAVAPAAPKGGGQKVSQLVNGQTVSGLGPMSYDKTDLEICEGSCSITMIGAGGAVQVSFFKGAYEGVLMSKSGPVYISGLVRKKGSTVKIILSGVK